MIIIIIIIIIIIVIIIIMIIIIFEKSERHRTVSRLQGTPSINLLEVQVNNLI